MITYFYKDQRIIVRPVHQMREGTSYKVVHVGGVTYFAGPKGGMFCASRLVKPRSWSPFGGQYWRTIEAAAKLGIVDTPPDIVRGEASEYRMAHDDAERARRIMNDAAFLGMPLSKTMMKRLKNISRADER